jgi:hypothetical protein
VRKTCDNDTTKVPGKAATVYDVLDRHDADNGRLPK